MNKINLNNQFSLFNTYWDPKIVGELNGQHVKLAKFQGVFDWHHHANEDEFFLVVKGAFDMHFRDRVEHLQAGDFIIVPRGTEHRPVAQEEAHVLMFEPTSTLNTGEITSPRTVANPEYL